MRAVSMGDIPAAQAVLQTGVVTVNMTEKLTERTMVMLAAARGHDDLLRWLIRKGADYTRRSKAGRTALMEAAYWNRLSICKFLVSLGVEIREVDFVRASGTGAVGGEVAPSHQGLTANRKQPLAISIANSRSVTQEDKSALTLAKERGNDVVYRYLVS